MYQFFEPLNSDEESTPIAEMSHSDSKKKISKDKNAEVVFNKKYAMNHSKRPK